MVKTNLNQTTATHSNVQTVWLINVVYCDMLFNSLKPRDG